MADDLESKSIEELEQMMVAATQPPEVVAEADEQSEPEEIPEVVDDEPQDTEAEPVEAAAEETPGQPVEAEAGEPDAEPTIEEQIRKTLVDEAEARAKHFESVAGRNAGELGFVKKQLTELQQQLAAALQPTPATSDDPYAETPAPVARQPTQSPRQPDQISLWATTQAVKSAASEFYSAHADCSELSSAMSQYLTDKQYDAASLLESNDPVYAARETARALDEAYWHARGQHQATVRTQLEAKRADQIRGLQKAKMRGGPTQSGATPTPRPVAKTLDEKSVDELREELERLTQ